MKTYTDDEVKKIIKDVLDGNWYQLESEDLSPVWNAVDWNKNIDELEKELLNKI